MLSRILNNSISYPTEIYYQYNLYLIKEYELFADIIKKEKVLEQNLRQKTIEVIYTYAKELSDLLENNISHAPEHTFSVMDWEARLIDYSITLKNAYKKDKITTKRNIILIEMFARKIKLKKLNEI